MKSIVIYASRSGNTRKIAEAITEVQTRGEVQLFPADEALSALPEGIDLVVIGGSSEWRRMTEPVARLFAQLGRGALRGTAAAAFDTRLRGPHVLSGSAGAGIACKLR
ncbi:MAG TPA: flavodoxin domain-containing protein [Ktedonobacterales bacterium]|nr:flavodoxin domain-containing protein [Ktedonobacterales bacterium]